jgi:hypothetical protein
VLDGDFAAIRGRTVEALAPVAEEVRGRMRRVLEEVRGSFPA